jgi:hypothetical protein
MIGNWFGKRQAAVSVPPPTPYRAENLTVRIKHTDFIQVLQAHGVPPAQMPVTRPLCGELLLSYAFDTPEQFVMATPPLLAQAGLDVADLGPLDQRVQANFKGAISAQLTRKSPGLMGVRTGHDLEAVMLVLDGFWSGHVRSLVQGDMVVCAPRRDVVLVADTAVPGALDALQAEALRAFHATQDAHALSLQMMHWTDAGWCLYAPLHSAAA